jgi:hypothetical protein
MQFDATPARRFLAYADGERPLDDVWDHPAYADVVQRHADLMGRDLERDDVDAALDGAETTFRGVEGLADNRERIEALLNHVDEHESEWVDVAERQLTRITPDEDPTDVPVYLGVGYEFGIGTMDGAFLNLNEPLFLEHPRQALYVAIHESSHVIYDRVHGHTDELGFESLATREGQVDVFETLFHTEAFATYTPLALRRAEDSLGAVDHLVTADYAAFDDEEHLADLVAEYDEFRARLREERVEPSTLFQRVFGESRLPYRLGCAMLDRLERERGLQALREAFYRDPSEFLAAYDGLLDVHRSAS